MPEEKTCAYETVLLGNKDYKCSRRVWMDGGPVEKFCLFHSVQYKIKKESFRREIDLFKKGKPTDHLLSSRKDVIKAYYFIGFKFPMGCSDFSEHVFDKDACFHKATFNGEANFEGATFKYTAIFKEGVFNGFANFNKTVFTCDARFDEALFEQDIHMNESQFENKLIFDRANFIKSALFIGMKAGDELRFDGSKSDLNIFIRTTPIKPDKRLLLSFRGAVVKNHIAIVDSEIKCITASGLKFDGVFTIMNVVFNNDNIDLPTEFKAVYLKNVKFVNVDFETVELKGLFFGEVIFDRITFGKPTTLGWKCSTWLLGRPNEAIYEERYARYCDEGKKKDKFGAAETVYRTLKHEMEKQHAKGLARRMRAGELECKLQGLLNPFKIILLFGYRFLNGFGLRWIRALVFWLACVFLFAYFGYNTQPATFDVYQESTSIEDGDVVINQRIVPQPTTMNLADAIWHSLETTSVIARPSKQIQNPGVHWVEGLERVFSPFLLFLFLQAARNAARD